MIEFLSGLSHPLEIVTEGMLFGEGILLAAFVIERVTGRVIFPWR